jgi:hypothetical protein
MRREPLLHRLGHDADRPGEIEGRKIGARPLRTPPHGGDELGVPGGGPGREEIVGLSLVEPRRKITEGVAGQKDNDAGAIHENAMSVPGCGPADAVAGGDRLTPDKTGS